MKKLLSCLFLFLPFLGMSQKYAFQSYSTEEGLPQTQVRAFCRDNDGYLWVGTLGGLAKFNGDDFTSYSPDDGLLNNRIQSLFLDGDRIWVGHDGGVSYIENGTIKKIEFYGTQKSRNVVEIIKFNGRIIICSNRGGGLHEIVNDQFKRIDLPNEKVQSIRGATISGEYLYLATRGGMYKTKDLVHFVQEQDVPEDTYFGVEANDEQIYFITLESGIYRKDLKTNKIERITRDEIGTKSSINGAELDSRGVLWLYTSKSVFTISHENNKRSINLISGLPVNTSMGCVFDDSYGNIWLGSNGKGMFRFPGEQFQYFDRSIGYFSDIFLTGFESKNGALYFGSFDAGVVKKTPDGKLENIDVGASTVWSSLPNIDGYSWFGTSAYLVSLDENDNVTRYSEEDGMPGNKISALFKVGPREMYIGGNEGIAHYKNGVFTNLYSEDAIEMGTIRDFVMDGDRLIMTSNLGLFSYEDGEFSSFLDFGGVCYSLEKDNMGTIWFGSEEGLFRVKGNEYERIELRKNASSNFINFIYHKDDRLYVGSNNGLFVLSNLENDKPRIIRFGLSEGLVNLETNLNSGFFDSNGNFWCGTATGLLRFNPSVNATAMSVPGIQVKNILLNYQPFDYSTYSELDKAGFPKHLNLPYSRNNLIFELDGISLSNHRWLNYQFYLEGLSDKWSPLTSNPTVTFTSLPAGEYKLRMRCADIDGRTSEEIVIPFTIRPAFYRTWWFIGLCILAIGGLVVLIFRFRVRRINKANELEKLEFKSRLLSLEQQSMNASMNRHFVFNSLNSIQYFINTRDRLSANKYLTNFAKLIRKNLDTATVDGNMITLEEELERLELYLSLESMRFKDRFDYVIDSEGVETDSFLIPAMILQPFVENSIIHGILPNQDKKGLISLTVSEENGYLTMAVEDNGVGVNQSITKKGDMEGDHRSKGMEITSKRIDLIQKISNNDISLVGPFEVYNNDRSVKGTRVLLKIPLNNL